MTTPNQNAETIAGIPADKAQEIIETRKATAQANKVPFPGALREAFATPQSIEVGGMTVRPFYDGDFDTLQALEHPLHRMALGEEDAWGNDIKTTRGQIAWNLCYLMTTPVEEIEKLVETTDDWRKAFQNLAKMKFSKFQYKGLVLLQTAIVQQFTASFSTVIGFEEADEQGGQKKSPES